MNNQPLLSICIPTYNRQEVIEKTIKSIVEDEIFLNTSYVELVISDNCSTDNTEEICRKYADKFPDKIVYSRNKENIGGDANFKKVLSLGHGKLLKLQNDKCAMMPNKLAKIISLIQKYSDESNIIFFSNGVYDKRNKQNEILCSSLDSFINHAGDRVTWINCFSIWKNVFDKIDDFESGIDLQLIQTDVLCRLMLQGAQAVIWNEEFVTCFDTNFRGGYNPALVFGKNYLTKVLKTYLNNGDISKRVYEQEKKRVLKSTLIPFYFDFKGKYQYTNDALFDILLPIYKYNYYFYFIILASYIKKIICSQTPLRNIYTLSWYHLQIKFYTLFKNESKIKRYTQKLEKERQYQNRVRSVAV